MKATCENPPSGLIHHLLEKSANKYPSKTALIHGTRRISYIELNQKADALATWLVSRGAQPGDQVVIFLTNSIEFVVSYYGILKAGCVAVPMGTDLKPAGLQGLLLRLQARHLITSSRFERVLKKIDFLSSGIRYVLLDTPGTRLEHLNVQIESFAHALSISKHASLRPTESEKPASIIFTSGSTGTPKGVLLSHRNVVSNVLAICDSLDLIAEDIQMVVIPFFYVYGMSLLNTHIAIGGSLVINNKLAYPAEVLNQMVEEKVTGFSGVPSTYSHLLHRSPLATYKKVLTSLRYCSQAGGAMPQQTRMALMDTLPAHTKIYVMYGATEASARISCLSPDQIKERHNSIGKPISGVRMRIIDRSGNEAPDGKTGELTVEGPNIMLGYWNDPESTQKVLSEFGYHTGDIGYRDVDGYYYVVGRQDKLIKVGGHRFSTQEVEEALLATHLVIDSVVLSFPDDLLGNRLAALVVPKDKTIDENTIITDLSSLIPKFKLPRYIKFARTLPLKANGKIDVGYCRRILERVH